MRDWTDAMDRLKSEVEEREMPLAARSGWAAKREATFVEESLLEGRGERVCEWGDE
jgi:hypothetical protein